MIKEIIKNAQKQPISFHFNTRLSIIISGNERAVMLINKTSAVPSGTPLPSNDWMTGITPAWLAYKGAPATEAKGTAYQFLRPNQSAKNVCGI